MKRVFNAVAAAVLTVLSFLSCSKTPGFDFDSPYIDNGRMHMYVGDTRLVRVTPDEVECEWSSSDKDVAKVSSNGRVTAVSEGQCTITASVGKGSRSFELFVTAAQVTDFKMPESVSVLMTKSVVVPITDIVPSNGFIGTIDWRVEDPTVAEVQKVSQDGVTVAGLTVGNTVLNATLTVDGGIIAKICNIRVYGPELSLTPASSSLTTGKTVQLTLKQTPHFSDVVTWSSDDEAIAKVDRNGLVTAGDKSGEATITASIGVFEATAKVSVKGADYKIKIISSGDGYNTGNNHFNYVPLGIVDQWTSSSHASGTGVYADPKGFLLFVNVKYEDGTDLSEEVGKGLRWTPGWTGTLPRYCSYPKSTSCSDGDFLFNNGTGRIKVEAPNGSEASVTCSPKISFKLFNIDDPSVNGPKMEYVADLTPNMANDFSFTGGTRYLAVCVSDGSDYCYPLLYTCSNMGGTMNWSKKRLTDGKDKTTVTCLECGVGHYIIHVVPFDSVDNKEVDKELGYVNLNITVTE